MIFYNLNHKDPQISRQDKFSKILIPTSTRKDIFFWLHLSLYQLEQHTYDRQNESTQVLEWFWNGMNKNVISFLQEYPACQKREIPLTFNFLNHHKSYQETW